MEHDRPFDHHFPLIPTYRKPVLTDNGMNGPQSPRSKMDEKAPGSNIMDGCCFFWLWFLEGLIIVANYDAQSGMNFRLALIPVGVKIDLQTGLLQN